MMYWAHVGVARMGGGGGSYRSHKTGGQGLSCKDGGHGCKVLKKLGGGGLREVTRLEGRVLVTRGGGGGGGKVLKKWEEVGWGCEGLIVVAKLGGRVLH